MEQNLMETLSRSKTEKSKPHFHAQKMVPTPQTKPITQQKKILPSAFKFDFFDFFTILGSIGLLFLNKDQLNTKRNTTQESEPPSIRIQPTKQQIRGSRISTLYLLVSLKQLWPSGSFQVVSSYNNHCIGGFSLSPCHWLVKWAICSVMGPMRKQTLPRQAMGGPLQGSKLTSSECLAGPQGKTPGLSQVLI